MAGALSTLTAALAERYRIERELGQGGMATVYLAEDVRHHRKVAIKVLHPELSAVLGPERFLKEIELTANLQHPHILPLFDSGTADGQLFYVMPLVDGETLRARLERESQLPVAEAVRLANDVADALDYAHRHGVIHRDIKPENILLQGGHALVADFGIALAVQQAGGQRMTQTGLSLGTPHYMSPEQATADKEITGRSDIYSLASVLYEMLTGSPPHTGSSAQQIIMKIITEQPQAVTVLRRSVPPNVAAAVMKGLEKVPADRFATAREFADGLSNPTFSRATAVRGGAGLADGGSRGRGRIATFAIGAALLVSVAAWGWVRPVAEPTLHVTISPLAGTSFIPNPGWPALSPDGRTVVFAAMRDGETRLYRRPVDGFRVEPIEGSDDATYPFFSPDGAWVGYFTRSRQLRKIALTGGQPTTLAEIPFWRSGAAWRSDRTIVVTSDSRGLYSVPENGGTFAPLAESDTIAGAVRLDVPQELEDGRLLATRNDAIQRFLAGGKLLSMEPGEKQWRPVPGDAAGVYVPPGFLITRPGREVIARRFDLANGRSTGKPVAVLDGLFDAVTVNARGDVAYFAFPTDRRSFLALVDRAGNAKRLAVPAGYYRHPRLSPDGTRLALNGDHDLWIIDLRTSALSRLTTNDQITEPQWSPDGRRIIHTVFDSASGYNVPASRSADGAGDVRVMRTVVGDGWTSDWSPDGRHLAVYGGKVGMNVSVVDLDSAHAFHPITSLNAIARNARFSPDGRWLAYQSNETGRMQVYVISYPDLTEKRPVSTEGGMEPAWRPRGGELYYRNGPSMMAVTIRTTPALEIGMPRQLFRNSLPEDVYGDRSFDVMPDGEHFLMLEPDPAAAPELRVIRNWAAELKATVQK